MILKDYLEYSICLTLYFIEYMIEKKDIALEKVVLVGIITQDQDQEKSKEYFKDKEINNQSVTKFLNLKD